MNKQVIIGIVAVHKKTEDKRTNSLIRDEVKQAIFDNGGIAIGILSPNEEIMYADNNWKEKEDLIKKDKIIEEIKLCDGIILQGGSTTEAYADWIAKYCYDNDIPILGICAGQNCVVRGLGGKTYKIPNPEKHSRPFDDYVHSIKIQKNSKFFDIINKEEIMVNSRHKNAVLECPELEKVAFCEDGYADVVESKNKKFYIGVRFHPESLYKIDENMNNIFKRFIEVCENTKL